MSAATLPMVARAEEDQATTAKPDDARLWSVTTICNAVGTNDGLIYWALAKAADCALNDADLIASMAERDRDTARKFILDARYRPRDGLSITDAQVGTWFHALAEEWVVSAKRPDDDTIMAHYPGDVAKATRYDREAVKMLLRSFEQWLKVHSPEYEAAELTVYNATHHYAGTLDGICKIGRDRWIIDYKTSLDRDADQRSGRKRPWSTSALQLSGYRFAEFAAVWRARRYEVRSRRYYLLSDTERAMALPVPPVDGGLIVHVTPDHCDSIRARCDEEVFREGFRAAIAAARWVYLLADDALDTSGAHELNVRR